MKPIWNFRILLLHILVLSAIFVTSCAPSSTSATDKEAAMFNANMALSNGECDAAISIIDPYYNSALVDNQVRKIRASAYACKANVNFFQVLDDLMTNSVVGSALWRTLTKIFPSNAGDSRMEAAWFASETLMTWLDVNQVIPVEYSILPNVYNPGSLIASNRDDNGNVLNIFVSMALIGATQYRYGKTPSQSFPATFNKLQALPWTTSTLTSQDTTGCAYAGSIMTMFDSLEQVGGRATGTIASQFAEVSKMKSFYDQACYAGCQGLNAAASGLGIDFSGSGCTMTAAEADLFCKTCPFQMRHRSKCANPAFAIDKNPYACAAAGIVIMINDHPVFGWPGP